MTIWAEFEETLFFIVDSKKRRPKQELSRRQTIQASVEGTKRRSSNGLLIESNFQHTLQEIREQLILSRQKTFAKD